MNLILNKKSFLKLKYYVKHIDYEISGMAKSTIIDEDNILVEDVIIFEQECSSTTTDLNQDSMAKFFYQLTKKGESIKDWNIWWHSHNNFDVFWSPTDEDTIKKHAGSKSYLISLVTNKAGHFKARLDIFPKDTSPFKKKELYSTTELKVILEDFKVNPAYQKQKEEIQTIIEEAEQEKEEIIEKYDTMITEAKEKLEEIKESILCNKNLEEKIKKEIKNKIKIKTTINYNYNRFGKNKTKKWKWQDEKNYYNDQYYYQDKYNNDWKSWEKDLNVNQEDNFISEFEEKLNDPFYYEENPKLYE